MASFSQVCLSKEVSSMFTIETFFPLAWCDRLFCIWGWGDGVSVWVHSDGNGECGATHSKDSQCLVGRLIHQVFEWVSENMLILTPKGALYIILCHQMQVSNSVLLFSLSPVSNFFTQPSVTLFPQCHTFSLSPILRFFTQPNVTVHSYPEWLLWYCSLISHSGLLL